MRKTPGFSEGRRHKWRESLGHCFIGISAANVMQADWKVSDWLSSNNFHRLWAGYPIGLYLSGTWPGVFKTKENYSRVYRIDKGVMALDWWACLPIACIWLGSCYFWVLFSLRISQAWLEKSFNRKTGFFKCQNII
jgi:hypothetical protein